MWLNDTTANLLFLPPPSLHHAIHCHRRWSHLTGITPCQLLPQTLSFRGGGRVWQRRSCRGRRPAGCRALGGITRGSEVEENMWGNEKVLGEDAEEVVAAAVEEGGGEGLRGEDAVPWLVDLFDAHMVASGRGSYGLCRLPALSRH